MHATLAGVGRFTFAAAATFLLVLSPLAHGQTPPQSGPLKTPLADTRDLLLEGRATFRFETFGDEEFWGGTLKLHQAIAGAAGGGVGAGLAPQDALALGLKLDRKALGHALSNKIKNGNVDVTDPALTVELLRRQSVVGVTGFFDAQGQLASVGIQCALCHSTVDDSVMPGIGARLDGWANRDLDIGKIIALAPDLSAFATLLQVSEDDVRTVLQGWGPGKFDAQIVLDGKTVTPDGKPATTLIPPAFGLQGVNLHTATGWGSVPYWNAFVAVLVMHGKGTFFDPRLDDAAQFPIAAANGFGHVESDPDLVTPLLPGLHLYQLALKAPAPPEGSFDPDAAERGDELFEGKAACATCHVEPQGTEPGWNLHLPSDIGIDSFQADRSPDKRYRTTPLRGLWSHQKGGFFHDGRFPTLLDVVNHYDQFFALGLDAQEKSDLVQYLLSL
jgi:hypothetical protein